MTRSGPPHPGAGGHDSRLSSREELLAACVDRLNSGESCPKGVTSVAWNPNDLRLASAGGNGTVKVWALGGQRAILTLAGHQKAANSVAWSPDGVRLASGGVDGTVRIWNTAAGEEKQVLATPEAVVWCVAWSPDGKKLAAATDLSVSWKIWETGTWTETLAWSEYESPLRGLPLHSVAWSPDGRRLASATLRSVKIWDAPGYQSAKKQEQ